MARGGGAPVETVVCELVAAGRSAAGRPAFTPGLPIAVTKSSRGEARIGDLVSVAVRGRSGRISAVHGPATSPRAVLRAILADEGLDRPFGRAVLEEAEAVAAGEGPGAADGDRGRRDMRDQPVITIDPEGAKDHDDAIAVADEGAAGTRLWVHIADVAYHVAAGGPIDREAARRGTSVYVPGAVVPMLPSRLSSDLCSLRPGEDRRALTAEMLIGPDGEVTQTRFHRSLIRSDRRLTYPEVDAFLAGAPLGTAALEDDLRRAAALAETLRRRRLRRGALEAASSEPTVRLEEDRVADMRVEGQTPSHSLVEECMIAANEAVARHLIARGKPTVFRFHDDPDPIRVERLYAQLEALEVPTPPMPGGVLGPTECRRAAAAAAEAVARLARRDARAGVIWPLVLRSLRQAFYAPDHVGHSGLASPAYLHFTSPIRRYPDLLVHRGLLDSLGIGPPSPEPIELHEAALTSSSAEREAAGVERRADAACAAFLLADRLRERGADTPVEGRVSGVIDAGAFVSFDEVFVGFLPSRRLEDDHFRADALGVALVGEATGRRLRIGDEIRARVCGIDALRGRIELEPLGATPPAPAPFAGRRLRRAAVRR